MIEYGTVIYIIIDLYDRQYLEGQTSYVFSEKRIIFLFIILIYNKLYNGSQYIPVLIICPICRDSFLLCWQDVWEANE